MAPPPPNWFARAAEAVRSLAARPLNLFCLLLALNALARPYASVVHDARLYGVQVLNQLDDGGYSGDLFFRFGSQDNFSLFSRIAAPLASILGVPWTFFLLYLAGNALFFYACQRFIQALIPDRVLSTLSLFFIAVASLSFGGLNVFHVHEPFLTPRLIANALVLFGLERALAGRWAAALVFQLLAGLMHPLMAWPGVLTVIAFLAAERLSWKMMAVLGVAGTVLASVILACEPLALRLFGYMDPQWRELVRQATSFNFPVEWPLADWFNLFLCFVMPIGALVFLFREDSRRARFVLALTVVAGLCIAGNLIVSELPYALLIQGQLYRSLWLLKLVQAPLGFWLAGRLWQVHETRGPLWALAVLGSFGITNGLVLEYVLPLFFFAFMVVGFRRLDPVPHRRGWLWQSLAASMVLGCVGWAIYKIVLNIVNRDQIFEIFDLFEFLYSLVDNVGPVCWLLLVLALLVRFRPRFERRFQPAGLAVYALVSLAAFLLPGTAFYQENFSQHHADLDFVRRFVRQQAGRDKPTIYCALGQARFIWQDLKANCYFDGVQLSGIIFNRPTAVEGKRRALLVRAFEFDRMRKWEKFLPETVKCNMRDLYQNDFTCPPPTQADLERLCLDPAVDFVVVKQGFAGLYAAGNGRLYIYDCKQVRTVLGSRPDSAVALGKLETTFNP
jgi:hypothetical protein